MRQVIYVCGTSGSGKTSLALQFAERAYVVHIDQLALVAAMRLCPFCKPGSAGDWELWNMLLKHTAAIEALQASFLQSHSDCLSSLRPVIIEGTILVWDQWREALREGLTMAGLERRSEVILWLNPPPAEIHSNIVKRARGNESSQSLTQVEEACQRYSRLVLNPSIERHDTFHQLEQRIESLMSSHNSNATSQERTCATTYG